MIYILPALSKDTNNDHIHGHIKSGHNGQNGKNGQNGHYGMADYGREYSRNWILWKAQEKCRSPAKTVLKKMHWVKSYGQNKIFYENSIKNDDFLCILAPNLKWVATLPIVKKIHFCLILCLFIT